MDIICRKRSCVYNKGFCCTKNVIEIEKAVTCKSFELNPNCKEIVDTSRHIFGQNPPKYKSHRTSKFGSIKCEAKCLFNKDGVCNANGITVNCIKNKPFCATHFKD